MGAAKPNSLGHVRLFPTQWTGPYRPWDFPGQNTGVGSLSLLQGIFPTQGSNQGLPPLQVDSLPSESLGKPPPQPGGPLASHHRMSREMLPEVRAGRMSTR